MSLALKSNIQSNIYNFLSRRVVYHSLIWLFILIMLMLLEDYEKSFLFTLSNEFINVIIYAIIVYFNFFYLIPNYLNEKKILQYGALTILSVIIITPIKLILFYFKFHHLPELQQGLIDNQYWYMLFGVAVAFASTGARISVDWWRNKQVSERERQELQTQTMQSELRFLKSQINPHFLFNTLNSLYALTLKKSDKAPEIVIKLAEMMRYMLYECNEKRVFLNKEVSYIRNYLDLEKLRHGKNVKITFNVVGLVGNQKIAPLMFIPFLENSFKHGLNSQIINGFVNIKLMVQDQKIHFHIENSKADSLPAQTHKRSGGIGLVNVRRRLDIIYPNHHQLDINENPNTYTADLHIELN